MLISGCSVSRRERKSIVKKEASEQISENSIIEYNLTAENFNIQKAEIRYIDNGTTVNLIASLKYRKNDEYLISLRSKTGIEMARVFITKDTILVNDRFNKKLYCGSSDYLNEKYGISADALPVIFGDLIVRGRQEPTVECFNGKGEIKSQINSKNVTFIISCSEKKVSSIVIGDETDERIIEIRLDNFQYTESKVFPGTVEILEINGKSEVEIKIKKVEFNGNEDIKFIPGTDYEKILIR